MVGLLATCQLGGGGVLVPLHELTKAPAAQEPQLVPAVVRGRTPAELLLECPGGRRLVAMHYKLLLAHCTLDQLLLLAAKVQVGPLRPCAAALRLSNAPAPGRPPPRAHHGCWAHESAPAARRCRPA